MKYIVFFFLPFFFACSDDKLPYYESHISVSSEDMKKLLSNTVGTILDEQLSDLSSLRQEANLYLNTLLKDGTWEDIDYSGSINDMALWDPYSHLARTELLSLSYHLLSGYQNERVVSAVNLALDNYRENNYVSSNWWYNSIGVCRMIGCILILMDGAITDENWTYFVAYLNKLTPEGNLGANKVDIATYHFYRGLCLGNDSIIKKCTDCIYDELKYMEHDGFQVDGSYLHNNIRYISGYGETVLEGIIKMASYTRDTNYAIQGESLKILSDFLIGTYFNVMRGNVMDYIATGRQISRPNYLKKDYYIPLFKLMKKIDTCRDKEYEVAINRLENNISQNETYTKFYWKAEYLVHCTDRFNISVGGRLAEFVSQKGAMERIF